MKIDENLKKLLIADFEARHDIGSIIERVYRMGFIDGKDYEVNQMMEDINAHPEKFGRKING